MGNGRLARSRKTRRTAELSEDRELLELQGGALEDRRERLEKILADPDADVPGPLYWLQYCTKTFDEKWKEKGVEPYRRFPKLPYLRWLFRGMMTARRLFVPKSREMMISWTVIGYGVWMAQFHERIRVIVQTQKEDKVVDLIKGAGVPGYARTLYERQDDWLKERNPLTVAIEDQSSTRISWANGSLIQGVPKGADQVRQYHPTLLIVDGAAHLDEFKESYGAADPVCEQIIAVSSAAPGWFMEQCQRPAGMTR